MSRKMNYIDQSKLWREHNLKMEKRMAKQRLQAFMEWSENLTPFSKKTITCIKPTWFSQTYNVNQPSGVEPIMNSTYKREITTNQKYNHVDDFKIGTKFQHLKSKNIYEIVAIGTNKDVDDLCIIYKKDDKYYTRSWESFCDRFVIYEENSK